MTLPDARIELHAAPSGVHFVEESLDDTSARLIAERVAAAHADGVVAGKAEAEASILAGLGALERAAAEIDAARERAQSEIGEFAVQLGVAIAEELIRVEIRAGRYNLEEIIRTTLSASEVGRGRCVVHLNPQDYELAQKFHFRTGTEIEPDPDVRRGEVHVTTPQGLLVRDIDSSIKAIRENLLGGLE